MSKRRKYALAALGVLVLLVLHVWSPWSKVLYRGDGKFSDSGFYYPRFLVQLPDIALNEEAEHHFRFAGLPHEEMSFLLIVKNFQGNERDSLALFPATIEAKLTDGSGNVACDAVGRPANTNEDGVWVLRSGADEAAFWHYRCNFVQVHTFRSYDLMVRVSVVGQNARNVIVTPILEGGGVELP